MPGRHTLQWVLQHKFVWSVLCGLNTLQRSHQRRSQVRACNVLRHLHLAESEETLFLVEKSHFPSSIWYPCHRDGRVLLQAHPSLMLPLQGAPLQLLLQSSLLWGGHKVKREKKNSLGLSGNTTPESAPAASCRSGWQGLKGCRFWTGAGFGLEQVFSCHWLIFVGSSGCPKPPQPFSWHPAQQLRGLKLGWKLQPRESHH